jgi:DNA-binding LytR/AlgR family response regulator
MHRRRLAASTFVRVPRSAVVNIDGIAGIVTIDTTGAIVLASGETVPLGPSYRQGLGSPWRAAEYLVE